MKVRIQNDEKIIEIWLSKTEKDNLQLAAELQKFYAQYSGTDYLIAVFESGNGDLYQNIYNVMLHNKKYGAGYSS